MPITKHNFIVKHVEELADTVQSVQDCPKRRPGPVRLTFQRHNRRKAGYVKAGERQKAVSAAKQERIKMALESLETSAVR